MVTENVKLLVRALCRWLGLLLVGGSCLHPHASLPCTVERIEVLHPDSVETNIAGKDRVALATPWSSFDPLSLENTEPGQQGIQQEFGSAPCPGTKPRRFRLSLCWLAIPQFARELKLKLFMLDPCARAPIREQT